MIGRWARCARGKRGPAAWPSASCRSTSRARCCTRRACCRSASWAGATISRSSGATRTTSPTSATFRAAPSSWGSTASLDCLDGMIFPAICDVIRNLSGMWQLQFPDRLSRYLDVPQNFDAALGGSFYRRELEDLSRELDARGARPLEAAALRASIAAYNENRRRVRSALRPAAARAVEGPDARALPPAARRAGDAGRGLHGDAATSTRRRWPRRRLAPADGPGARASHRLVLRAAAARSDQDARARRLLHRGRRLRAGAPLHPRTDVRDGGDPLDNLVRAFLEDGVASPMRYIAERREGSRAGGARAGVRRGGRDLLRAELLRPGPARPADGGRARWRRPGSRGPRSSSPRTTGSSRSSASRPGPSPTRSSCGARCDHDDRDQGAQGRQPAPPEEDDRGALHAARRRARHRREERLHLRARQPHRAAAELRPPAGAAGDQRAAVGDARQVARVHRGRREARALRGRLHVREVRHRA